MEQERSVVKIFPHNEKQTTDVGRGDVRIKFGRNEQRKKWRRLANTGNYQEERASLLGDGAGWSEWGSAE